MTQVSSPVALRAEPAKAQKTEARAAVLTAAWIAAACLLALALALPPRPVPASAPPTKFSAERAFRHVQVIAKAPRPAGSAANLAARAYVLAELQALGIPAEISTTRLVEGRRASEVKNVLARLPGRSNTKAFALTAHIDSVRSGPGAGDDAAGVAALLETARALRAGPPLGNDVVFLFTDGEESGLLGAKAFARHPWAADIGVLFGLEARGCSGGSLVFETSSSNGWLIAELARAHVGAFANSVSATIYERLPFSSDFTWLKKHGQHGLNASFIGDFPWYHTGNDRPEHLSLASLQQHGNYALGLTRHFGNVPLQKTTAPDAVYFNALGPWLIHYPVSWSARIALLTGTWVPFVLVLGLWRGRLKPWRLVGAVATFPLFVLSAILVGVGAVWLLFPRAQLWSLFHERVATLLDLRPFYHNGLYGLAVALAVFAVFLTLFNLLRRRIGTLNLAGGALAWWGILLALFQWWLPQGSYLAAWPTLFAALQLFLVFCLPNQGPGQASAPVWLLLLSMPAIALLVPGYQYLLPSIGIIAAPVLALIPVLLASLLMLHLDTASRVRPWWTPALAALTAAVLVVAGMVSNRPSPERPDYDCLAYGMDRDANQAFWFSSDMALDEWTSHFFEPDKTRAGVSDFFPQQHELCFRASAPVAALPGAEMSVISDSIVDESRRRLSLHLTSPAHAPNVRLRVLSDTEIYEARVFGERVPGARLKWDFAFSVFPAEGADLELDLPADAPLLLEVAEQHFGLPHVPGMRPRPPHLLCEPNTMNRRRSIGSDQILVRRTFQFTGR